MEDCGCRVTHDDACHGTADKDWSCYHITFCPLHRSAGRMREALKLLRLRHSDDDPVTVSIVDDALSQSQWVYSLSADHISDPQ